MNPVIRAARPRAFVGGWSVELLPPRPYEAAFTPDAAVIGFAFDAQAGVHAFGSDRVQRFRAKPNGLAFVPIGCDVYSRSERGGEYLRITGMPQPDLPGGGAIHFSDVVDPVAINVAENLRRALLRQSYLDPLLIEKLVTRLSERVQRVLSGVHEEPAAANWMTPYRLRCIDERIEAGLESKLTVQDLADSLGLSAGFFSRAFKAAVGKPPHDYIIDRRLSRARDLLQQSREDLSAVAYAAGFASHAHMTTLFRARLGLAPSALRARS